MPRFSKEHSEATRARVLDAARSAFAAEGYAGVGLERIAAAAGATRGAVYHHFTDKRALFVEVLGLTATDVADRIRTDVVDIEDPRESLERGCRSFFEAALDPACRQILLVDAPVVLGWNEWLGHDSAHSGRLLDDVINRLHADGRLRDVDPTAVSILLSGAMNEAALWVATAGGDLDAAYAVLLRFIDSVVS
ncbi:MAG TPA: TetR/AcrR family transcriptional regulator [Acidothermales bacterium]